MSALITFLWSFLGLLCFCMALKSLPPTPEKRAYYLVCYQAEGGCVGNVNFYVRMPLTDKRIEEMREFIKGMESIKGKTVIITNLTELAP